jgi:hypothetical protein
LYVILALFSIRIAMLLPVGNQGHGKLNFNGMMPQTAIPGWGAYKRAEMPQEAMGRLVWDSIAMLTS